MTNKLLNFKIIILKICLFFSMISTVNAFENGSTWQIQLNDSKRINSSYDVDVYDVDLFDTDISTIKALQNKGKKVICYINAGAYEEWRSDASKFKSDILGNNLDDWPGEKWLNITHWRTKTIMNSRLDLAVSKGCDAVELDNVNGYIIDKYSTSPTGFNITASQQLTYNKYLAIGAKKRGLLVGLKNDLEQIPQLVNYFDFIINEECHLYDECEMMKPFLDSNKAIFNIEYLEDENEEALATQNIEQYKINNKAKIKAICDKSLKLGLSTIILPLGLDDSFRISCN